MNWGSIGSFLGNNKDWLAPLAGAAVGAIGASSGPGSEETVTTSNAPWAGIQPYMTGGDPVPSWASAPQPTVSDAYMKWNERLSRGAEGSWNEPAPPMYGPQGGPSQTPWGAMPQQPAMQPAMAPPPQAQTQRLPPGYGVQGYPSGGGGGAGTPGPSGDWNSMSPAEKQQAQRDMELLGMVAPGLLGALPSGLSAIGVPGMNSLADFFGQTVPGWMGFESDYGYASPGFGGGGGYAGAGGYDGRGGGTGGGGLGGADSGVGGGPGGENESGAASGGR